MRTSFILISIALILNFPLICKILLPNKWERFVKLWDLTHASQIHKHKSQFIRTKVLSLALRNRVTRYTFPWWFSYQKVKVVASYFFQIVPSLFFFFFWWGLDLLWSLMMCLVQFEIKKNFEGKKIYVLLLLDNYVYRMMVTIDKILGFKFDYIPCSHL